MKTSSLLIPMLAMTLAATAAAESDNTQALKQEAQSLIKSFAGQLKPQLKKGLMNGGPVNAIEVCAEQAPKIAAKLSKESGWEITRVSLKPRNQPIAVADAWEKSVLEQFDADQARGVAADQLVYSEVVDGNFRLMKAQVVEGVCLHCHSPKPAPYVQEALKKHYPNDQAIGYTLGQVRGAFSLSKPVSE